MAPEPHDCIMFALAVVSDTLADRFHTSWFGRWELKETFNDIKNLKYTVLVFIILRLTIPL